MTSPCSWWASVPWKNCRPAGEEGCLGVCCCVRQSPRDYHTRGELCRSTKKMSSWDEKMTHDEERLTEWKKKTKKSMTIDENKFRWQDLISGTASPCPVLSDRLQLHPHLKALLKPGVKDESADYAWFFDDESVIWNETLMVVVTILTKLMMAKMWIMMMTIEGEGDEDDHWGWGGWWLRKPAGRTLLPGGNCHGALGSPQAHVVFLVLHIFEAVKMCWTLPS